MKDYFLADSDIVRERPLNENS